MTTIRTRRTRNTLPRIALIGRRNVGKSSLLNALCRKRYAITDKLPGLTRDILEITIPDEEMPFILSDTPGLDLDDLNDLNQEIKRRTQEYLKGVDVLVQILAAPYPEPFDLDLISFIRKNASKQAIVYVINKIDDEAKVDESLLPFYEARINDPIPLSARGRWNMLPLIERIKKELRKLESARESKEAIKSIDTLDKLTNPENQLTANEDIAKPKKGTNSRFGVLTDTPISLAIVGRPNAGKSSLFNKIIDKDRVLVSDVPGTTRDAVDSFFSYKSKEFRIIDTAGMRRPSNLLHPKDAVEFFSLSRTKRFIREAKLVIQVLDGGFEFTDLDKRISNLIQKSRSAFIFAVSKRDLLKERNEGEFVFKAYKERFFFLFPSMQDAPFFFYSAKTGQGLTKLLDTALALNDTMDIKIPSPALNKQVKLWVAKMPRSGQKLKILYVTQWKTAPPAFLFFVNDPKHFNANILAYFSNCIRKTYGLEGIPFNIHPRKRTKKDEK